MERMTYRLEDQYGNQTDKIILETDYICMSTPKKLEVVLSRLAAYEDTGLEPETVEHLKLASMGKAIAEITEFEGIPIDRLRELAQADKEGRVKIEEKARKCPKCGKMKLFPRIDWQYYYCYSCKTQFTKSEYEAALRREQDG